MSSTLLPFPVASQDNRTRKATGITLSDENRELLKKLSDMTGIPVARIIERALNAMLPVYEKDPSRMFKTDPEDKA